MSYERLLHEHDRIDRALARLQRLTDAPVPDVPAVSHALSDLAGELVDHLAHEDSFIYPRMIESTIGQVSAIARGFVDEFAALSEEWKTYIVAWLPDCIAGDWDGFKRDTDAILARLAARVRAENTVLYSAALNHGLIPLRE
jgi:iron-sulfur cluster repair protein YtfE (RIC family)